MEKDKLRILRMNFGDDKEIVDITTDGIKIDADIDFLVKLKNDEELGSDSSFLEKKEINSKNETVSEKNQKLTPEQERYIRLQMAKYGGIGKDIIGAKVMTNTGEKNRALEKKDITKKKISNVFIDKKHGTIIDGVK